MGTLPDPVLCPECGRPMTVREGSFDPFFGCTGFPDCRVTRPVAMDGQGIDRPVMTERDVEEAMVRWLRQS